MEIHVCDEALEVDSLIAELPRSASCKNADVFSSTRYVRVICADTCFIAFICCLACVRATCSSPTVQEDCCLRALRTEFSKFGSPQNALEWRNGRFAATSAVSAGGFVCLVSTLATVCTTCSRVICHVGCRHRVCTTTCLAPQRLSSHVRHPVGFTVLRMAPVPTNSFKCVFTEHATIVPGLSRDSKCSKGKFPQYVCIHSASGEK